MVYGSGSAMPPIWPFKKKKEMVERIDEAPPAPVVYRRGKIRMPGLRLKPTQGPTKTPWPCLAVVHPKFLRLPTSRFTTTAQFRHPVQNQHHKTTLSHSLQKHHLRLLPMLHRPTIGCITPMATTTNNMRMEHLSQRRTSNKRTGPTLRTPDRTVSELAELTRRGLRRYGSPHDRPDDA